MPWQQLVADIALEFDPKTKRPVYREVRLTVPRQSGKSTLILPTVVMRAECSQLLGGDRQRMLYAAQTGSDARRQWRTDYLPRLETAKAMKGRFRVYLPTGNEAVIFRDGSTFSPTAMTTRAGHGQTLDAAFLDEAFAQVDDRVDQAWDPAMITRPFAQKWIVSTVGTTASTYLKSKTDTGRAAVDAGVDEGIAYFEWSADEDADPGDPRTWWSCMPALGHTQTEEAVRQLYNSMALPEFRRSLLNQWTDRVAETVIPVASWRACEDSTSAREGRPAIAVDVSPSRSTAAVAFAAARADGLAHIQVVRHEVGTDWVAAYVKQIALERNARCVVLDRAGPVGSLIIELEQGLSSTNTPLKLMNKEDMKAACGSFYDAVVTEQVRHVGQSTLDMAISGADRRQLDDAWAWKRRTSVNDISPLVAVTAALWGLSTTPDDDYDILSSVY